MNYKQIVLSDGILQTKCPAEKKMSERLITTDKCERYFLQTEKLRALHITNNSNKVDALEKAKPLAKSIRNNTQGRNSLHSQFLISFRRGAGVYSSSSLALSLIPYTVYQALHNRSASEQFSALLGPIHT